MTDFVYDLPAFNIVPGSEAPDGPDAGNLSSVGSGEIVLDSVTTGEIAIGNWGDGPGAPGSYTGTPPTMFPPTLPSGATLTKMEYVVRAYVEAPGEVPATIHGGGFFVPSDPASSPCIYLDHTSTSDGLVIEGFPTSTYGADVVVTEMNVSEVVTPNFPRVRVWYLSDFAHVPPIHIDYMALRVTYSVDDGGGTDALPAATVVRRRIALRNGPRDDELAMGGPGRNHPPPKSYQAGNRNGGGYL